MLWTGTIWRNYRRKKPRYASNLKDQKWKLIALERSAIKTRSLEPVSLDIAAQPEVILVLPTANRI